MSASYDKGKQKIVNRNVDLASDNLVVVLCKAGYVPDLAVNEFIGDISGGDRIAQSGNLASKTIGTGGVFDAADITLAAVTAGSTCTQLVIAKYTGNVATSPLLWWLDQVAGLPLATDGQDVLIEWATEGIAIV